jgi:two-component system nitrogen regulation response regulator GlnG
MAHVMVLDDEPSICWAFRGFLGDDGHRVTIASSVEQGLERLAADPPDVLFLDVRLPGMDGLSALDRIRGLCPATPVVVMTAYGTVQTAVRAVRGGAFDYLPKPFDLAQARLLVERALESGRGTPAGARAPAGDRSGSGEMVGRSLALQAIFKQVALAAACSEPVLILGESGTGKELVARAIHQHGDRANQPFVPIHLAALPEGLVERELFGHEKGAYTGADAARPGLLDRAAGGTVFLDEVAEAPAAIQAKLLRVLDGGEYRPVGGGGERHLKARVVAATNRDLAAWVRSGAFRADLFYRLAVLPIQLPPLRDRPEDILPLWDHFLARLLPTDPGPTDPASPLAKCLLAHDWPGNVRELRNAAEHAARAGRAGAITPDHLPAAVRTPRAAVVGRPDELDAAVARWVQGHLGSADDDASELYDRFLDAVEAPLLRAVRSWAGGNQVRMARRLGLHRTTLRQKLRRLGLDSAKDE